MDRRLYELMGRACARPGYHPEPALSLEEVKKAQQDLFMCLDARDESEGKLQEALDKVFPPKRKLPPHLVRHYLPDGTLQIRRVKPLD